MTTARYAPADAGSTGPDPGLHAIRLPLRADYAIRALSVLASAGGKPVACLQIATAQQLPVEYLRLIMRDLLRARVVVGVRGRNGGYVLGRTPEELTVAAIVRSVRPEPLHRTSTTGDAERADNDVVRHLRLLWARLNDAVDDVLGRLTLADVLTGNVAGEGAGPAVPAGRLTRLDPVR